MKKEREKARYEFIEQSNGDGFLVELEEEKKMDKSATKHLLLHKEEEGEVILGINGCGKFKIRTEIEGTIMYFHGEKEK